MYKKPFKTLLTLLSFLKLVSSKYVCETDDPRLDNFFFVKGSENSKANGRYTIFDYEYTFLGFEPLLSNGKFKTNYKSNVFILKHALI